MRRDTLKSVWRAGFSVASIQVRGFSCSSPCCALLRSLPLRLSRRPQLRQPMMMPSSSRSDVFTGGSWSEGKQGGFYRAIVVMSGSEQSFGARVYLQWLALSETDPIPKIIATVPLKEVNDQNLGNASIEIEGEESKDKEITIIVSSYDFDADKDISLYVKGTAPGKYAMAKAPGKSPAAAPVAAPTNVPKDD